MFFFETRINQDVIDENYDKVVQILLKTLFIISMKGTGALVQPNGITKNS